jgi:hypothetical protein
MKVMEVMGKEKVIKEDSMAVMEVMVKMKFCQSGVCCI